MLKKIYYWFHKKISKPEERDAPSGGVWPNKIREEVVKICRNHQGRLLEVGCGEGLFISRLAVLNRQLEITGVDNNLNKLSQAKRKCDEQRSGRVKLIYTDATCLPLDNEHFDSVVCINVFLNLESIVTVKKIIAEISRGCKCKGKVIFDFRNALNPLLNLKYKLAPYYDATIRRDNLPLNTYHPEQIKAVLEENNFKIINKKYVGFPCNFLAPIIIVEAEKC